MPYIPSEKTSGHMEKYHEDDRKLISEKVMELAQQIAGVSKKYGYDGAFLGELNFSLTRLIQELPRMLMRFCGFGEETRYWMQAGIIGVLLDVALEYKRRVNTAYEAAQIVKSGDCYDTPYYTRLVEVVNADGETIGHMEIMLKRSTETLNVDVLPMKIVLGGGDVY